MGFFVFHKEGRTVFVLLLFFRLPQTTKTQEKPKELLFCWLLSLTLFLGLVTFSEAGKLLVFHHCVFWLPLSLFFWIYVAIFSLKKGVKKRSVGKIQNGKKRAVGLFWGVKPFFWLLFQIATIRKNPKKIISSSFCRDSFLLIPFLCTPISDPFFRAGSVSARQGNY